MPIPAPATRIASESPVLRVQGTGQPMSPGEGATERRRFRPGTERAEGAFGVFGMMISGLIIIFAIVLLFLRFRNRG